MYDVCIWFPEAGAKNCHKLGGLQQWKFFIPQFLMPDT